MWRSVSDDEHVHYVTRCPVAGASSKLHELRDSHQSQASTSLKSIEAAIDIFLSWTVAAHYGSYICLGRQER